MAALANATDDTQLIEIFGPSKYNNFDEPVPWSNRPENFKGILITFLVLSWVSVCLRLWVRMRKIQAAGWDDFFVILYLIFCTITTIMVIIATNYGLGQHYLLMTLKEFKTYMVLFYVFIGSLTEALAFIKLSLLFQFLRIFSRGTWPYRATIFGIVFVSLWALVFSILAWFPCTRPSDAWNVFNADRRCWATASSNATEFTASLVSYTVINMLLDMYILALPIQLYFQSQVTFRTRMGLLVLLLMGACVNVLSIWRLQDTLYHKGASYPTKDPTWYSPLSILLSVLEANIASICASVPIFWPVLSPYLGSIFVTREISVEHEYRDDSKASTKGSHARTGSEAELTHSNHYENSYVLDQVDPFRAAEGRSVESRVGTEGGDRGPVGKSKKKWWKAW